MVEARGPNSRAATLGHSGAREEADKFIDKVEYPETGSRPGRRPQTGTGTLTRDAEEPVCLFSVIRGRGKVPSRRAIHKGSTKT